jgi:hypothetical protein
MHNNKNYHYINLVKILPKAFKIITILIYYKYEIINIVYITII